MSKKQVVLVLCTGNSCRSQMAEGWLRKLAPDRIDAYSAGTAPAPAVHPLAIEVMAEAGVDLTGQRPKSVREYEGRLSPDFIMLVCDAAASSCPRNVFAHGERLFWAFDDPARLTGEPAEVLAGFRRVRDEIADRLKAWLAETG
jgi:arsenate reductase